MYFDEKFSNHISDPSAKLACRLPCLQFPFHLPILGLDSPSAIFLRVSIMDFLLNLRCDANGKIGITDQFLQRRCTLPAASDLSSALPLTSTPDAVTASSDRIEWTSFVATSRGGGGGGGGGGSGGNGSGESSTMAAGSARGISRESSPTISPASTPTITSAPFPPSSTSSSKGFGINLANAFQAVIAILEHVRDRGLAKYAFSCSGGWHYEHELL